ncbi:transmembrane protein, putative (macronuclear) [Tetrahymena thermophila SB210]|uniref:Transmembrane protein, putative n=1 Tax=Tetrahymena thermophila (strain SB210) TaxID=312017 RepID=I7MA90_TETTS|nr:transmembrane protein, putative [Tetrahymena thermophila SB210]EAS03932.2 transmembrane protein, putative [Tetrahymena thermophila SB210]|eukprot:XP_001024177.2 transmembrane protein, putative [Tetrahymena thermophila SB210]
MIFKKIDIFSETFLFNIGNGQRKQKTILGSFFSIITITTSISYLIFLILEYLNNRIDPTFSSQDLVSSDPVSINLTEDLFAFRYEYQGMSIEQYQAQQNKTYLVIKVYFLSINGAQNQVIPLNLYQCQNVNLVGYNCIDFTSLQDQFTLSVDNINNIFTQISIGVYGCYDIDSLKTDIPDNCASQNDIENLINVRNSYLAIKYFTQQYQIQHKSKQTNFKQVSFAAVGNQVLLYQILIQKQITQFKEGLVFQTSSTFSAPLSYTQYSVGIDRQYSIQNLSTSGYLQILLSTDTQVKYISIQYPSITSILAQVNSLFSFFMVLGIFAKNIAQKILNKKLFLLFLQNQYQDTYEKVMQYNNLFQQNYGIYFQKEASDEPGDEKEDFKNTQNYNIPLFQTKLKSFPFSKSPNQIKLQENLKLENQDQPFQALQEQNDFQQLQLSMESTQIKKSQLSKSIANLKQDLCKDSLLQTPKIQRNSSLIDCLNQPQSPQELTLYKGQSTINLKLNYTKDCSFQTQKRKKSSFFIGYLNQLQPKGLQQNNQPNQNNQRQNNQIIQYYVDKLKALQNPNSLRIVKKLLFKKGNKSQQDDLNYETRKKLEDKFNSEIDIFKLYKDIIFLKKAIMILLSKDQLAALQLVGCQIDSCDPQQQDVEQGQRIKNNVRKKNYYEEQLSILQSQELLFVFYKQILKQNLNKQKDNQQLSDQQIGNGQRKQKTIIGSFFSIITITTSISYLIFLIFEYLNNRIDPNYNSQVQISPDPVSITLTEDLFAFRYEYLSMRYNCIDFTSLQDQFTLTVDNINNIFTQISIGVYGCYDIDSLKTDIPDNCASQSDIENLINFSDSYLSIKYFTQQYEIQHKNKQTNYNQIAFYVVGNQKQITQLKEGLIFQTSSTFSSPLSFTQYSLGVDRQYSIQNVQTSGYLQIQLYTDTQIKYISIQYPSITQILAQVNSLLSFFMILGLLAKSLAQKILKKKLFLLFLQNKYQDTYEKIMQYNNLFQQNQVVYFQKEANEEPGDEKEDFQNQQNNNIPTFQTNLKNFQFSKSSNQIKQSENHKLENENQTFQALQEGRDFQQLQLLIEPTQIKKKQLNKSMASLNQDFFKDSPLQTPMMQRNSLLIDQLNQPLSSQDQTLYQGQSITNSKLNYTKDCSSSTQKRKKSSFSIGYLNQLQSQGLQQNNQPNQNNQRQNIQLTQYYVDKLKALQNPNLLRIVKKLLFKNGKTNQQEDLNYQTRKKLEDKFNSEIDIFKLYKDIIFLKKAIMILLSKDQLAALQLVGCQIDSCNQQQQDIGQEQRKKNNVRKKNYYEEQLSILQSQELQCKHIKSYLQKCNNSINLGEVDYRIISSIIRNQNLS